MSVGTPVGTVEELFSFREGVDASWGSPVGEWYTRGVCFNGTSLVYLAQSWFHRGT
jgi:hypothetical protein